MASPILEMLQRQIGGEEVAKISRRIGADEDATQKAIQGALPMLVSALAKNTSSSGGASSLLGALDRDHDGSILDDVAGFLGQGDASPGSAILKHVLGGRRDAAENGLGRMSGLDRGSAGKLLAMLAPIVMGAIGKAKRERSLDRDGLAGMLQGERQRVERKAPEGMGMLSQILDSDGDGEVADDVARIGMSMLGNLFGGRR